MRQQTFLLALLLVCLAGRVSQGQIVNGDYEAGVTGWSIISPGDDEFSAVSGAPYGGSSNKGYVVSSSDTNRASMATIRSVLSNSGALPGWGATSLTGDTSPGTLFFSDGFAPDIASGTSIGGSVIYQDFMGASGNKISFEYKFLSLERAPASNPTPPNVDFAFVAVQDLDTFEIAIHRLADTTGPHTFSAGPVAGSPIGSSGVQTGFITELNSPLAAITLPGTGSGNYRVAFGVIDVGGGFTPSGLMLDSVQLGVDPVMEIADVPGGSAGDPVNLNFGTVRVGGGVVPTHDFEIRNVSAGTQPSTLLGTLSGPTPGGAFTAVGPPLTNFNLQRNTAQPSEVTVNYQYAPTARGTHNSVLTVNGNDVLNSTDTVNFSGVAVGPVYNSTSPNGVGDISMGGNIDLGIAANPGDMVNFDLSITNTTTDGNQGALTELNILGASFAGVNATEFSFLSTTVAGPLQAGDPAFQLSMKWNPVGPFNFTMHNAQLLVQTDVGAPAGQPGQVFVYNLSGQVGTITSLPEPASMVVWVMMGLVAIAFTGRLRNRKV